MKHVTNSKPSIGSTPHDLDCTLGDPRVLVTAALPYANGDLHVGHIAGAYLPADIFTRFLKLKRTEVRSVCGSDDHGVAVMLSAQRSGRTPQQVVDYYHERQADALSGMGINFDIFGSTSRNPFHKDLSQEFFRKLYSQGHFERATTQQFFDPVKGLFLPDRFVRGTCAHCSAGDQNGDQCEDCGNMLDVKTLLDPYSVMSGEHATVKDTVHWFLDLTRFEDRVRGWLDTAFLREGTRTYVESILAQGLVKRSMTRDLPWGVPVPLDDPEALGKVLYVWFDAPIGYISNTMQMCAEKDGNPEHYQDWWKASNAEYFHFIGEDNTIFHTLIWIAMLSANGDYQLPAGVIVNNFLNISMKGEGAEKMSKSRGTAVWINEYLQAGGDPDALRYYLTAVAPENGRTVFQPDELARRYESELADVLGNFAQRTLTLSRSCFGATIPEYSTGRMEASDREFLSLIERTHDHVTHDMENFAFKNALSRTMGFARECNRYFNERKPWVTRKTDIEATRVTMALSLQALKLIAVELWPFLPEAASKIGRMLSFDVEATGWHGATAALRKGDPLTEPVILFKKSGD